MNTRSIRFRLIAWYAGLLGLVFVLLGALMYAGLKTYLEQSMSRAQIQRAEQIADTQLANLGGGGEAHVIQEINAWFAPETNDRFIRLTRGDGSVLYVSKSPHDLSFDARLVPPFPGPAGKVSWSKTTLPGNRRLLIAAVPARSATGALYLVEVGASLEPVDAFLRRLVLILALALAAMVAVATIGGLLLVGQALGPVEEIARGAEQITLHNLTERLPVARTGDELERLALSLNHMIARLEDALQQNRRFLADASHELRTPLTIIRGELETIVEAAHFDSEVQGTAATVLDEVERLARIVEGLFAISRLDAGEAQKEWVRFDLATLATSTADQMCLLAEDKGIAVTCVAPEEVPVDGDRARMKQVVVNLLDNAIKYTPSGGAVRLAVRAQDGRAVMEVEDNGIGIPAEACPRIFQRFFRVDQARSREMGGAGLGLSIVKSICAAHGGQVDFQSAEGRGSRFKVELPLSPAGAGKAEPKEKVTHGN